MGQFSITLKKLAEDVRLEVLYSPAPLEEIHIHSADVNRPGLLLAGGAAWVFPTLVIKFVMAFIMGTIIGKNPMASGRQLAGAAAGGIFQIGAYTLVKVVMIGIGPALLSIPNVTIQTGVGIVLFAVLVNVLMKHAPALFKIRGEAR